MKNETYVNKILALMAKAESTTFPGEAEALFAKAQELMTKHAIDEALLVRAGERSEDKIVTVTVTCEAPYGNDKSILLYQIANANGCRSIRFPGVKGTYKCGLTGYASDVEAVQALFASLVMHATRDVLRAEVPAWDSTKSFRHAFLHSFALRIGQRLTEARNTAKAEVDVERGVGTSLVLVEREERVEAAFRGENPHMKMLRTSSNSFAGSSAGRDSANRAGLNQESVRGARGALK